MRKKKNGRETDDEIGNARKKTAKIKKINKNKY